MLIVVNDIVFSRDIWDWYHARRHEVDETRSCEWSLGVFFQLLPESLCKAVQEQRIPPITYQSLTAAQFWNLLYEIYLLLCDLQKPDGDGYKNALPVYVSVDDLERELSLVERMVVFWATTKGHSKERLGLDELDHRLVVDQDGLGLRFSAYAYCMVNAARDGIKRVKTILGEGVSCIKDLRVGTVVGSGRNEFGNDADKFDDFVRTIVRMGYGGDFDEFILAVISDIQNSKMGPFHEQLAQIKGYELMGSSNVQESLPATEVWRRLFNTYFDKEEDNFKLFYSTYTAECVFYLCKDYLHIPDACGISYLPIYRLYSLDGFRETAFRSVRPVVDTARIRRQILKLYNMRVR